MPLPVRQARTWDENLLLAWIVRGRWVIFTLLGLILAAGFNGQWRVGRDSALYRAVAENLSQGRGYTFRGERERQIYPGLPLLLAGVDRVLGPSPKLQPVAPLLLMMGMAVLTLIVIYRLMGIHFPPWVAVCVTSGVAINLQFMEQANELMTDMPFLLGTCLALLGFERLRQAEGSAKIAWALATTFGGLALAILMRPTAMAVAAAWVGACLWGLLRGHGHERRKYALALGLLVVLGGAFWLTLDPRADTARAKRAAAIDNAPLVQRLLHTLVRGKYESDAFRKIQSLTPQRLADDLRQIGEEHFPESFFSISMGPGVSSVLTLVIILSGVALIRRFPLWGLLVLVSVLMTVFFGSTPRYYLMILPLLLLGWARLLYALSLRAWFWPYGARTVMFTGMLMVVLPNLGKGIAFIEAQHGIDFRSGRRSDFLHTYRGGKMEPIVRMSQAIAASAIGPEERIIGPEPRIMSYLSGRRVYDAGEFAPRLRGHTADPRITSLGYATFPAKLYDKGISRDLLDHSVRARKARICGSEADGFWVSRISIVAAPLHRYHPPRRGTRLSTHTSHPRGRRAATTPATTQSLPLLPDYSP